MRSDADEKLVRDHPEHLTLTDAQVQALYEATWIDDQHLGAVHAAARELAEYRSLDMLRVHVTIRQPDDVQG
jgi:hypothetical protein